MPGTSLTLVHRLYLASALILLVGWLAAAAVFVTATPGDDPGVVAYRIDGGRLFPITLEHSTPDVQLLEAQGGRANLVAGELNGWMGSLWHSRPVSYTRATVSAAPALLCDFIARSSNQVVGP